MFYLIKDDMSDSYSVFNSLESVPEYLRDQTIEVDSLPEGNGILKMDSEGNLYYEPYPKEPETPEDPEVPEPEIPESITQPTIEEMQMQTLLNTEYLVVISELSNL